MKEIDVSQRDKGKWHETGQELEDKREGEGNKREGKGLFVFGGRARTKVSLWLENNT